MAVRGAPTPFDRTLTRESRRMAQTRAAVQSGLLRVTDRFGNPLDAGDLVLLHNDQDIVFKVTAARPLLDPASPPGLIQLTFEATFPMVLPAGQPVPSLIKLGGPTQVESQTDAQTDAQTEADLAPEPSEAVIHGGPDGFADPEPSDPTPPSPIKLTD